MTTGIARLRRATGIAWLNHIALPLPYLLLCTTEEMYLRAAKSIGLREPTRWLDDAAGACTHTLLGSVTGGVTCIVCIAIDPEVSGIIVASRLAHEAVHVCQEMFLEIGEDKPGAEIEAYAIENCTRYLLEEYARQTKVINDLVL